uniref:Uncharacterized protein n=1 Tax=Meloidogyne enterolobii TaxID=390850 RepID=A0A6V7X2J1_MELEN|nr:unnamed protein product [Meloidogyne enterolobii]
MRKKLKVTNKYVCIGSCTLSSKYTVNLNNLVILNVICSVGGPITQSQLKTLQLT